MKCTGASAITSGFTNGNGRIWLSGVQCFGNEQRIIDCPANLTRQSNCVHDQDAGVRCGMSSSIVVVVAVVVVVVVVVSVVVVCACVHARSGTFFI